MKIVKDLRVLKKLGKTYNNCKSLQVGNKYYTLQYVDGCFNPYCIVEEH